MAGHELMESFDSMAALALEIGGLIAAEAAAEHHALDRACVLVEKTAKSKFGEYQPGWAALAASTVSEKERLGYAPPDNPLLREGAARDSIEHRVEWPEGHVGSDSQIMVWQELGTSKMPPRSTLALSAAEKTPEIVEIVGSDVFLSLVGEGVMGSAGRMTIE